MVEDKGPKWGNRRNIQRCACDELVGRSITSRKCGVYKVYNTYDRIILKCPLCQKEQSFRVKKTKKQKEESPYPEIQKK